jgi:hypothetical protein
MTDRKMILVRARMDRFLPCFPSPFIHFSLSAGASASHPSPLLIVAQSVSRRQRPRPRRVDNEKERKSKSGRRLRRLEKTVEALSHGPISALTQLKSESGGQSGTGRAGAESRSVTHPGAGPLDEGRKAVAASDDATGALLTALSGMTLSERCTEKPVLRLLLSTADSQYLQRRAPESVTWHRCGLIVQHHIPAKETTTFSAASQLGTTSRSSLAKTGPLSLGCLAPS